MEHSALYYPYVHFRDDDWLKKTLLVFPHLVRMVADDQVPYDNMLVRQLSEEIDGKRLITRANLHTENVIRAQGELMRLIRNDLESDPVSFQARFGLQANPNTVTKSFQMNLGKTSHDLAGFLRENGLAWKPADPEQGDYWELHPTMGHAVLGTIAVACAEDAGLNIVAQGEDSASRELNWCLASGDVTNVYDRFIRGKVVSAQPEVAGPEMMLDFIVQFRCDVSSLDAKGLVELSKEREALRALKCELQKLAANTREMKDKHYRQQWLTDETNDILKKWKENKANLGSYAKRFFGLDASAKGVGEALKQVMEKIVPAVATGAVSASAPILGVAAGLGIGVIIYAVSTAGEEIARSSKSPFRYLTQAEKYGVVFTVGR